MPTHEKRDSVLRAERLKALANHPEWQEFLTVCKEVYDGYFTQLIEAEDPEARGGMKAIDAIISRCQSEIAFGEKCRRELWEELKNRGITA